MAAQNPSFEALQRQLDDLTTTTSSSTGHLSVRERADLLNRSRHLVQSLEPPEQKIARMVYHYPLLLTCTRVLIDLGVFKLLDKAQEPQTAEQLAREVGAEGELVERMLKHVASDGLVLETGADTYAPNAVTRMLASPGAEGCVKDMFQMVQVYASLPSFLQKNDYKAPKDRDASPWHFATGEKRHFFEYVMASPERVEAFRGHMSFKNFGLQWHEEPGIVQSVLGSGMGAEDVLLVDVGGSGGHQLVAFRERWPDMGGRLVVQDLPGTIDALDKEELRAKGVEALAHDFFTEQPLKGAKAYYLKQVLHDWPGPDVLRILRALRPAMKPGYSKILINEIVIPDQGAQWLQTSVDVLMMSCHAAQERREREWRALVEEAGGLKVSKVWDVEGAVEKVLEVDAV